MRKYFILFTLCFLTIQLIAQGQKKEPQRWKIKSTGAIEWNLDTNAHLPHSDNIEMAGKRVAGIVSYAVDTAGYLSVERQIFFPQLHPFIKDSDLDWFVYRAYVKDIYKDDILPTIFIEQREFVPGKLKQVTIDGQISFLHHPSKKGLQLKRTFLPSMSARLFVEEWTITNTTSKNLSLDIGNTSLSKIDFGDKGKFTQTIRSNATPALILKAGESHSFQIKYMAQLNSEGLPETVDAQRERNKFLAEMEGSLNLVTPDPVLNTLFELSKIRASESIFESEMGLIHSPGGGRYYVGFWANDQAEYVSPLFPYLNYDVGNESAMNCYRAFAKETNPEYKAIRYAFEIEGLVKPFLLDRGDAAMIAYGASHFALANGDIETANELWPLIEWCLEYCHRQLNESGVVKSESDEMEGRIETGTANLSTSTLYYGALSHSIDLTKSLNHSKSQIDLYQSQQKALHQSIESYFGAKVEGLDTYKYYAEHTKLRHWICMPLVVGIHDRKEATTEALFDRLWTDNGVYVEKNSEDKAKAEIFWDRGTLYALRGTFFAGATDVSLQRLQQYSRQRLLGKRVPYAVEAYPEGSMAHLSAESGLYCRVFTEGLFGMVPKSFKSFECTPRLPEGWDRMSLQNIRAFGSHFDLTIRRGKEKGRIQVVISDRITYEEMIYDVAEGKVVTVRL